MTIARSVEAHLNKVGISYDLLHHPHSNSSLQTAMAAHLSPNQLAKAILVRDGEHHVLCVIPTGHRLVFSWLNSYMNRRYEMVQEHELREFFSDCEVGAVPALGQVYGLPVIWDSCLENMKDVYIESGDHENLIHVNHSAFMELMGLQDHMIISCPEEEYREQMSH